jgi:uncharacterized protein YecE (DUF72 family)
MVRSGSPSEKGRSGESTVVSAGTYIGTSGWHYDHWKGPFYPSSLRKEAFLEYYAGSFGTAEVNNSFYRLPERETLLRWRNAVPESFVFSVKASRYLTHMKKLKDAKEPLERLFDRVSVLEDKLGPVLFQLPPRWRSNPERLEGLLEALPEGRRYAFEFRDRSWFDEKNYELLRSHGSAYWSAYCVYDLNGKTSPKETTADFAYVRLHGPDGPYWGRYGAACRVGWHLLGLAEGGTVRLLLLRQRRGRLRGSGRARATAYDVGAMRGDGTFRRGSESCRRCRKDQV